MELGSYGIFSEAQRERERVNWQNKRLYLGKIKQRVETKKKQNL